MSEFNLGIEYIDAIHLGKDLVPGTAVGATIAFDNEASKNGQFSSIHGDIVLSPKYYPYISEWHLGGERKELSLLGKESFLLLRAYNLSNLTFHPDIDEEKVVRYVGVEKKMKGVYSKIIYPDGSIVSDGVIFPDFDKVDKMTVK